MGDSGSRSSSNKDSNLKLRKNMNKSFYDCIFEDTLAGTIFTVHRELAIGKATGIKEEEDEDIKLNKLQSSTPDHYDIFSNETTSSSNKRAVECKCFVCHRMIAALRFAPHLEKCIGGGRNSRVSRRRLTNFMDNTKATSAVKTRASSNLNITIDSHLAAEDLDLGNDEEEEEDEWSNNSANGIGNRRRPKTRYSMKRSSAANNKHTTAHTRSTAPTS